VPAPFSAAAGAALGGKMYVIGGNGDPKDKAIDGRQVFAYDVATNKWSRKASLPKPRTNLAAVALGGKIYALGGLDPSHATDSVYVYDPKTNRWSIGPTLPEKLHALAAVVYQGGIWVIGGQDAAGQAVRHVWIYQPRAHSWHKGPSMPFPMETAGAAVADGELHVVLESKYLIYDPNARKWRRGPSLETPRHALAVFRGATGGLLQRGLSRRYARCSSAAPVLRPTAPIRRRGQGNALGNKGSSAHGQRSSFSPPITIRTSSRFTDRAWFDTGELADRRPCAADDDGSWHDKTSWLLLDCAGVHGER